MAVTDFRAFFPTPTSTSTTIQLSSDNFEHLYQRDMTVIEFYNCFMELAQYFMAGNIDTSELISRFMSQLQQPIIDKIAKHRFSNLMNCYTSVQLAEANSDTRNASILKHVTWGAIGR